MQQKLNHASDWIDASRFRRFWFRFWVVIWIERGVGLRGVEEIHAHVGQMPVLEDEPVHTGRKRVGCRGEFQLNDPQACADFGGLRKAGAGEFQFDVLLV